jgi:hypothetical protein
MNENKTRSQSEPTRVAPIEQQTKRVFEDLKNEWQTIHIQPIVLQRNR